MVQFCERFKILYDNHAEASEIQLLKVEVFYDKRLEVVSRQFIKQRVRRHLVGCEGHHKQLPVLGLERERSLALGHGC